MDFGENTRRILTREDAVQLKVLGRVLAGEKTRVGVWLSRLHLLLARAQVVPADKISPYRITMDSQFTLRDHVSREVLAVTLVFPGRRCRRVRVGTNKFEVPILTPIGISALGLRVGDTIAGRISIERMIYQPEAEADINNNFTLRA